MSHSRSHTRAHGHGQVTRNINTAPQEDTQTHQLGRIQCLPRHHCKTPSLTGLRAWPPSQVSPDQLEP